MTIEIRLSQIINIIFNFLIEAADKMERALFSSQNYLEEKVVLSSTDIRGSVENVTYFAYIFCLLTTVYHFWSTTFFSYFVFDI